MASNISRAMRAIILKPMIDRVDTLEDSIVTMPEAHRWDKDSPRRFHIVREAMATGDYRVSPMKSPSMMCSLLGIFESMRTLAKNPTHPRKGMSPAEVEEFEAYLRALGICSIGYTRVPARWVFWNKAILHSNAIVTAMEMDKARIDTAPGPEAGKAAHVIYCKQGQAMNKGAAYLRERGYSVHAGHPLMGMALYPPLAQLAGIGQLGRSGLIITPEHGPRVRLAAIFTSIENLPLNTSNPHQWVAEYCNTCLLCLRKCPTGAIRSKPLEHKNGQVTCVDNDRCFPYFMETRGCSICIKVCPFHHAPYERIRETYRNKER